MLDDETQALLIQATSASEKYRPFSTLTRDPQASNEASGLSRPFKTGFSFTYQSSLGVTLGLRCYQRT